jgi:general L-amino acid transport system permease protein
MRRPSGDARAGAPGPVAAINNPRIRGAIYQFVLVVALLWIGYKFALNAKANLDARDIASGLGFLNNSSGFGINLTLIPYDETSTYGRVFWWGC